MKLLGILVSALIGLVVAAAGAWPMPASVFYGVLLILLAVIAYRRVHERRPILDWRGLVLLGLGFIGVAFLIELLEGLTGAEILKSLTFTFPSGKRTFTTPGILLIGYILLGVGPIKHIHKATIPRVR